MSSAKVNVIVYDGARRVETLPDRPVRLMPDQRDAGIVYAGDVYPLYSDNSISLNDRPAKKALCYRFVAPSAKIPYAGAKGGKTQSTPAISRWYLESNRFGHYIVFDGSRTAAADLVDRLKTAHISVVRWDESVRSADNGEMYDWFIRLDYDGTAEQCRQAVAPLLQPGISKRAEASKTAAKTTAEKISNQDLELLLIRIERDKALQRIAELEPLAERAEKLEQASTTAKAKSARLERQVEEMEAQLKQQATTWTSEVRRLREHLKAARAERDQAQRQSATSDRVEQILAAKASAEADWQQAAEEAESLRSERDALTAQTAQLRDELEFRDLQIEQLTNDLAELENVERERRTRRQTGAPQGGSYEDFMSRLLPRIDIDPDDLDLLREWPSPRDALHQLLEIDNGGRPRRSKSVERKQGWTEVPGLNTGQKGKENLGRIYFRAIKATGRVRVCMQDKQDNNEQDRFIDRLPDV